MKKLIPAYILAFVISFMLFLYEPIVMYGTNINDFWFDLSTIISPLIILFISSLIIISILFSLLYYFNNRFFKGKRIYELILLISYAILFSIYIEGNYLSIMLPALDGSLTWDGHTLSKVLSIIIWILPIMIFFFLGKRKTYESVINVSKYFSLGITVMLIASLFSVLMSSNALSIKKKPLLLTKENLMSKSKDTNFYILVLDTIDSLNFANIVKQSDYQDTFNDFTYFPDTVGAYLYTRDSIPFILSNKWNLNEEDFLTYINKALDSSSLFQNLQEKKYSINIYDTELIWDSEKRNIIDNKIPFEGKIAKISFYKQVLKYDLYKYLPFQLKKYSRIETLDFNVCKSSASSNYFTWNNIDMYNNLDDEMNEKEEKIFKFIHLEGAHPPFNSDKDLNIISNGTHEQKEMATLKLINKFINTLKNNNSYDNSIIIIMSDHGINEENLLGRQNPILYIKGLNEQHEMLTSDLAISYDYLSDIYNDLLNGKKSSELLQNYEFPETRKFILYRYLDEKHMEEYEVLKKAWDIYNIRSTGRVFDLKK